MSFTVQSRGFFPVSSAANMWDHMESATMAAADEATGAAVSRSSALKERVCMVFFESGECPYNDYCEHAHHFSELDAATQSKLLNSVPMELIPLHFMDPNSPKRLSLTDQKGLFGGITHHTSFGCPNSNFESRDTQNSNIYDNIQIATHTPKLTPTPGPTVPTFFTTSTTGAQAYQRGIQATAAADSFPPAASLLDASFSSHTTTSCYSSSHGSPTLSSACVQIKSVPSQNSLEGFQIQLPARCHYPHSNITGTYYDILGVDHNAVQADIVDKFCAWQREGYKQMRLVDPSGAEARDRLIVEARNVLGHSVLRAQYDRSLANKNIESVRSKIDTAKSARTGTITKNKSSSGKGKWRSLKL
ncbi:unnamed protein product [Phytomonas sp. EM1]|nr:unnamed protein product [Phytomonas sp. EM1]|eukprot:CCW64774.1 unnamed protein product [Phytomonas sp. isolate EM1]